MAKPVTQITLGIDTAKDELVAREWSDSDEVMYIPNDLKSVRTWLRSFHGAVRIAIEPTSTYHLLMVDQALALDYQVYLISPRQLSHYREAVNERNKTDPDDAYLLARYLDREVDQLRAFQPQSRKAQLLWGLLKRRAVVVEAQKRLRQSLAGIKLASKALFNQLTAVVKRIERRMKELIRQLGWWQHYQRCLGIPGIGPINAIALTVTYHRGAFSGIDAFISFIGLDVCKRESGKFKGKRKLSKRGESELRRLLYCAAKPSRSYHVFDEFHQSQLNKGLSRTEANVILARKLARVAFALMRNGTDFISKPVAA